MLEIDFTTFNGGMYVIHILAKKIFNYKYADVLISFLFLSLDPSSLGWKHPGPQVDSSHC